MNSKELNLRRALSANAIFSACSGLFLIIFHTTLAQWMHIGQPLILLLIGIGLLLFAGSIVYILRQKNISRAKVRSIIVQDWLWVAGSTLILLFQAFGLSTPAYWIIALVALIVMSFALLQQRYLV